MFDLQLFLVFLFLQSQSVVCFVVKNKADFVKHNPKELDYFNQKSLQRKYCQDNKIRPAETSSVILYANDDTDEYDPTGLKRGKIILPMVMLLAIWFFTIPPEFRRSRLCSEQQVIDNPKSKCITAEKWISGIQEYYRGGGGIQWDFSIDPDN
mmetsp:Transcript_24622/g.30279  ORF Transcript_24622/g.30279 Transcript_24622/m.30279 type:complete len:153 (+) Transcript_24622:125-583(+)